MRIVKLRSSVTERLEKLTDQDSTGRAPKEVLEPARRAHELPHWYSQTLQPGRGQADDAAVDEGKAGPQDRQKSQSGPRWLAAIIIMVEGLLLLTGFKDTGGPF